VRHANIYVPQLKCHTRAEPEIVKLCDPLITRATSERFCDEVHSRNRRYIKCPHLHFYLLPTPVKTYSILSFAGDNVIRHRHVFLVAVDRPTMFSVCVLDWGAFLGFERRHTHALLIFRENSHCAKNERFTANSVLPWSGIAKPRRPKSRCFYACAVSGIERGARKHARSRRAKLRQRMFFGGEVGRVKLKTRTQSCL